MLVRSNICGVRTHHTAALQLCLHLVACDDKQDDRIAVGAVAERTESPARRTEANAILVTALVPSTGFRFNMLNEL